MAIGDFENPLPKRLTRELAAYSSAWWDMRHAAQIMHSRSQLGEDPAHYFARRGLLDGAVITYARCFADGRRTPIADIQPLLDELSVRQRAVHDTVMWWRNKHVAHRVDQDLELVDVRLLWGNFGVNAPTVRTRVQTRVRPDDPDFEPDFEALAEHLATRIWEVYLYPAQQQLFETLGAEQLAKLKAVAAPYRPPDAPIGSITVAMDIGSEPPGSSS